VLGHLPGVEFPHNFFPKKGDFFWTPADWAWQLWWEARIKYEPKLRKELKKLEIERKSKA